MLILILVILSLMVATGWLLLKFFGRLVNLEMLSVMGDAFQDNKLLFFSFVFCYVLFFIFLFISMYVLPMRTYEINKDHVGGLLGYNKPGHHMLFNPSSGKYEAYFWMDAPPPALKFSDAFEVVSFFKLPSRKYYQSTQSLHWGNNLMGLIVALLFLTGAYFSLYGIVLEHIRRSVLPNKVTHALIAAQFKSVTGVSVVTALCIFLSITALIIVYSAIKINTIKNHYQDLYATAQRQMRSELLKKVPPGTVITGLVIGGYRYVESTQDSEYSEGTRRPSKRTSSHTGYNYEVEFSNLIQVPVYLRVDSPKAIGNVDETSSHKKAGTVSPNYLKEYQFIVNPDYSVSFSL